MGQLVEGRWVDEDRALTAEDGSFVRPTAPFRDWVQADGSSGFPAEPGRYHLYVAYGCPWAHRTLIWRALKRLEGVIDVSVVHPVAGPRGWTFAIDFPGATGDRLHGSPDLAAIYLRARPDYTGRVTVPVLWDRERETIVNNESADIVRMLNREFDAFGDAGVDLYPQPLAAAIDALNAEIYEHVNNGVYRTGFATTQDAYERACRAVFAALDRLEVRLGERAYLLADTPTEADWRLFPTLVRFDAVYYVLFRCNLRRIRDYPHLGQWLQRMAAVPEVTPTIRMDHIKHMYYRSIRRLNPSGIVPLGPEPAFAVGQS